MTVSPTTPGVSLTPRTRKYRRSAYGRHAPQDAKPGAKHTGTSEYATRTIANKLSTQPKIIVVFARDHLIISPERLLSSSEGPQRSARMPPEGFPATAKRARLVGTLPIARTPWPRFPRILASCTASISYWRHSEGEGRESGTRCWSLKCRRWTE